MSDQFDEMAAEKLPCNDPSNDQEHHYEDCPAHHREPVAAALREAEQRGYRRGMEEATKLVNGRRSEGDTDLRSIVAGLRALLPAETEASE